MKIYILHFQVTTLEENDTLCVTWHNNIWVSFITLMFCGSRFSYLLISSNLNLKYLPYPQNHNVVVQCVELNMLTHCFISKTSSNQHCYGYFVWFLLTTIILKHMYYVCKQHTPGWWSYQPQIFYPEWNILAEAQVNLKNAWKPMGLVLFPSATL